jgi:hypothetical protein
MLESVLGIKFTIVEEGLVTNPGSEFFKGVKADSFFLGGVLPIQTECEAPIFDKFRI